MRLPVQIHRQVDLRMGYVHLSGDERYQIQCYQRGGFSFKAIARHLDRDASTTSRELNRNVAEAKRCDGARATTRRDPPAPTNSRSAMAPECWVTASLCKLPRQRRSFGGSAFTCAHPASSKGSSACYGRSATWRERRAKRPDIGNNRLRPRRPGSKMTSSILDTVHCYGGFGNLKIYLGLFQ